MAETHPTRRSLETRDPETAAAAISALWAKAELGVPGPDFVVRHEVVIADELTVGRMRTNGVMSLEGDPLPMIVVARLRSATQYLLESGGVRVPTESPLWLVPAEAHNSLESEDFDVEFFNIELRLVQQLARELVGDERFRLRFTGRAPVSLAAVRHWIQIARHVQHDLLGNPEAWANPLIRSDGLRALATATLQLFPNNIDLAAAPAERAEPAAVRRAKRFIDDNLGENISAQDIANAARVSLRGLQAAFRRHAGESPTAYLRRARLDAAHADLVAAAPGTSVEQVARRWGFAHLGRFAHDYRVTFGQLPSATLRGESAER